MIPSGAWIMASKLTGRLVTARDRYPCLCRLSADWTRKGKCTRRCPCWGRPDADTSPRTCCAYRTRRTLTDAEFEARFAAERNR